MKSFVYYNVIQYLGKLNAVLYLLNFVYLL